MITFAHGSMAAEVMNPCKKLPVVVHCLQLDEDFIVETLEGPLMGRTGDYLIRGVRGELYPIRQDIFEETYEVLR